MTGGAAQQLQQLRAWLQLNSQELQLDRATVRNSQPSVVTAVSTDGDLVRFEVTTYPPGTW
jgi:hypothetical protein